MASSGHNNDSREKLLSNIDDWHDLRVYGPQGTWSVSIRLQRLVAWTGSVKTADRCKETVNRQLRDILFNSINQNVATPLNHFSIPANLRSLVVHPRPEPSDGLHSLEPRLDLTLEELLETKLGPSDTIGTLIDQSRNPNVSGSETSTRGFVNRYQQLVLAQQPSAADDLESQRGRLLRSRWDLLLGDLNSWRIKNRSLQRVFLGHLRASNDDPIDRIKMSVITQIAEQVETNVEPSRAQFYLEEDLQQYAQREAPSSALTLERLLETSLLVGRAQRTISELIDERLFKGSLQTETRNLVNRYTKLCADAERYGANEGMEMGEKTEQRDAARLPTQPDRTRIQKGAARSSHSVRTQY